MAASKFESPPSAQPSPSSDTHRLVRERRFPVSTALDAILRDLRDSHAIGTLSIDIINGGVGSIHFREEQKVKFKDER